MSRFITVAEAGEIIGQGGVVAYPTEAVYGLGCAPMNQAAVERLLQIKQRPVDKGLILVAASYGQLLPFVDDEALTRAQRDNILARWPGPYTWVMPARSSVPKWLTGKFGTIAVRVSAHPVVQDLCTAAGMPVVSTSANLSGQPSLTQGHDVTEQLGEHLDGVVMGLVGGNVTPSTILDALSGNVLRS
ncbi:L-threonylcarbamoyladenylate synthase [Ferrimonas lipolytica]|uniref:Threonylcarbamoyl-AMP synthase n=1 Tax=Ferrimonas lipolytica TaxID=2724191 RepID=A0A6H1UGH9_9GAMM|nr:L-threonylcarbamoyladenylate synthase [Ferrimonas lipolytica]QIZ78191.1 threonylcarbamoyl-AMP synthase [Ferrimonas lipolytica]